MKVLKREDAVRLIKGLEDGKFFTVVFRKRTTGELREMNCRQRVVKHLRGGEAAYSFESKGLVSVYDVVKKGYRCFALNALMVVKANGEEYVVDQQA